MLKYNTIQYKMVIRIQRAKTTTIGCEEEITNKRSPSLESDPGKLYRLERYILTASEQLVEAKVNILTLRKKCVKNEKE